MTEASCILKTSTPDTTGIVAAITGFLAARRLARPYYQAYERGVKLIGATAHYVTGDLDEGPIIEQEVHRVDHTLEPEELTNIGHDIESVTLNRAVRWHAEHRGFVHGNRTVVLR